MPFIVPDIATPDTFEDVLTEFYARGFDYLNQDSAGRARAKRWVNRSYLALCEAFPWPFLEDEATTIAPVELGDMRAVLSVIDSTNGVKLPYVETRNLTDCATDLALVGTPSVYWLEDNTVNVYPTSTTVEVTVRYLIVPEALVEDDDELVIPPRFTDLVVDGAVIRGLKDSDNFESAVALKNLYDTDVLEMASSLMVRNHSGPDYVASGGDHTDG